MSVFRLPDLGEGLTEAVLVRWLVAPGDEVVVDQAIAEVETAKSIVELPSPFAGTVAALHGAEGDTIEVGAPVVEVTAADAEQVVAEPAEDPAVRAGREAHRREERAGGSGNVLIGYGTSGHGGAIGRRRAPRTATRPRPAPQRVGGPVAVRSPIVRRLAREQGLDLRAVPASGPGGVVTRGDVLRALSVRHPNSDAPATGETVEGLAVRRTGLGMLRKTVAAKMSRSRSEIPEATVWVDVDLTGLWELRERLKAEEGTAPSLTAMLARFTVLALAEFPVLGGRLSEDGTELLEFDGVHLGVATDTARGLLVPVIRGAHRLSVAHLDAELRRLASAARDGTAAPADLTGSTFTFNNYGALGVDGSAAIINHPEVAILGIGRIIERPWVVDGEIVPRRIAQLSLVFDHRVCDGGYASGFLAHVVRSIEHPLSLFARL